MPKGKPTTISPGTRFGRLIANETVHRPDTYGRRILHWRCTCDCGKEVFVKPTYLARHAQLSCGCYRGENMAAIGRTNATHGESLCGPNPSAEYTIWMGVKTRCCQKRSPGYQRYGANGINMCERWRNSYEAFLDDVGRRPSPFHSLDRYPNKDGDYEPGNVRWATTDQQSRNRRDNVHLTCNGETRILEDWARLLGVRGSTIQARLARGWNMVDALTTPAKIKRTSGPVIRPSAKCPIWPPFE